MEDTPTDQPAFLPSSSSAEASRQRGCCCRGDRAYSRDFKKRSDGAGAFTLASDFCRREKHMPFVNEKKLGSLNIVELRSICDQLDTEPSGSLLLKKRFLPRVYVILYILRFSHEILLCEKAFRILLRLIREAKRVSHRWKNLFV